MNLARQGEFLEKLASAQEVGYSKRQFHKTKKSIAKAAPEIIAALTNSASTDSVADSERSHQRFGHAPSQLIGRRGGFEPEHIVDLTVIKESTMPKAAGKEFKTVKAKKEKIVEQFSAIM